MRKLTGTEFTHLSLLSHAWLGVTVHKRLTIYWSKLKKNDWSHGHFSLVKDGRFLCWCVFAYYHGHESFSFGVLFDIMNSRIPLLQPTTQNTLPGQRRAINILSRLNDAVVLKGRDTVTVEPDWGLGGFSPSVPSQ